MKDRHYALNDEPLSAGNNGYTYDADGDRISGTINGVTTAFGYDYDNQLVSITTGTSVVGYAYDALGRRVSRTAGGVTTTSLYDGGRMILEAQGGTFTGTYTYGVSLIRRNEEFFQYDGLGSVRTFTNASGTVTAAATYDGFGNTVATSGSTSSPYQFGATSGYRNDGDAGIMQVGARYYDPTTGSFLTRDTDLNQLAYLYCWDDPIDRLDPSGHWPSWVNTGTHFNLKELKVAWSFTEEKFEKTWDYLKYEMDYISLLIDQFFDGAGPIAGEAGEAVGAPIEIHTYDKLAHQAIVPPMTRQWKSVGLGNLPTKVGPY